ncbi:variant erythrocyte surface antigen-1 family protein [Babesia caballi]|uniref:Variant erythrocyte surface antigen-1 family protein n=1 Tax=Babesia caballi TaxID=5871 RepID=A0AAV4LS30_BABCB|nr:variant erythrocyte surface antigen-1 family protein [Babesia caballi]
MWRQFSFAFTYPSSGCPSNLKEAIDWILRLSEMDRNGNGDSNKTKLPAAVEVLGDYGTAETILKTESIAGTFGRVAEGLRVFIGYNTSGVRDLDGQGIGRSGPGGYTSSYKPSAKWDGNPNNPATYAHILLCSMPLLYYGITHTFWQCTRGNWKNQTIPGDVHGTQLNAFMQDMNYDTSRLNNSMKGHSVMNKVGSTIDDFTNVTVSDSSTYPDFLQKLHQHGQSKLPNQTMQAPLYKLYSASAKYLQSKLGHSTITDLPQTQSDIEVTLKVYSEAVKKLGSGKSQKLSEAYLTLLTQIQSVFNQDPPASSSGAAAAGGILGTAAVAFNVGGITTTLKNLIPIFK